MIRIIQYTDAEQLWELVDSNRDYLKKWLPWLDANISIDDTRAFIAESLKGYSEQLSMVHVIIDELVCGVCGFNSINRNIKAGYIGYWIAENRQGRGIITESCRELEEIGFNKLKLNKIEIHVAQENTPSRKVAERLGYVETGIVLDAEWH